VFKLHTIPPSDSEIISLNIISYIAPNNMRFSAILELIYEGLSCTTQSVGLFSKTIV